MRDEHAPARGAPIAHRSADRVQPPLPGASSIDEADRALALALVAGDRGAFQVLVERESPTVSRTGYRVLGRMEDAEEATQETFVLGIGPWSLPR